MNIKSLISTAALVASMSAAAPAAHAFDFNNIGWSATADVVSEYVFRGTTLGSESTQLGLQADYDNFYVGLWTSNGFAEESNLFADELDVYAGYGFDISNGFSADVGATLYHYPQSGDLFDLGENIGSGDASTLEFYGGIAYDHQFSPAVYAYYDTELENFTVEGTAGYSYALTPSFNLDLSSALGYVTLDNNVTAPSGDVYDDYVYGSLGANVSHPFTDSTSGYFGINGGFSSEDTFVDAGDLFSSVIDPNETTTFWVGTGLSHSF